MSRGYGQNPSQEPLVWERVQWRQGDGRYAFEVAQGGLYATLTSPHGSALTLPLVAWEGLLDALAAARKTKLRAERGTPTRANARWSEAEAGELVDAFKAGGSIGQLARAHNRTEFAIESHLDKLGLWDRVARQPVGRSPATDDLPPWSFTGGGPVGARPGAPASGHRGAGDRAADGAAPIPFRPERD